MAITTTGRSRSRKRGHETGALARAAATYLDRPLPSRQCPRVIKESDLDVSEELSEKNLRRKAAHLEVVSAELDLEVTSFVARDASMQQRATVLIGAASITGALQVSSTADWASIASLLFSLVAALMGVVVIFPRTGDALDVRAVRDGILGMSIAKGTYKAIETKLEILEADEVWLGTRGIFARIGFISLTAGVAVGVLAKLLGA